GRLEGAQFEQPIELDLIKFLIDHANNFKILAHQVEKKLVTDLAKIKGTSNFFNINKSEVYKRLLIGISKDIRIIYIKIADRLHNMRTMDDMPDNSRKIKSSENLYLYSRLAEMAGFWEIKKELENRSFKYLFPDEFIHLKQLSNEIDEYTKMKIVNFQDVLVKIISIQFLYKIKTVDRSLYSVWNKMKKNNTSFSNIHNRFSTRIVIDLPHHLTRQVVYSIYLQITKHYHEKNNSLRDWIIKPKVNGFRALIFDVMYNGMWCEIQILSVIDDRIATSGYVKEKELFFPGLKNLAAAIKDNIGIEESNEIMERVKDIINPSKIFVFTPKGESIEMQKGVTVIDFAFRIHSDLGFKCLGAKINDNQGVKSPSYVLQTTQKVEILTSDKVEPQEKWIESVKTSRARKKLSNFFKKIEQKVEYVSNNKKANNIANFSSKKPFIIDENIDFVLAECCNPLIGDKAMVFVTDDDNIVIHKELCPNAVSLRATHSQNTTTVAWKHTSKYDAILTGIKFEGFDRMGILKDIINIITAELKINMKRINIENNENIFQGQIELYISNVEILNEIIDRLSKIENINKVVRNDDIVRTRK
ncbi:MAG: ACT domain-containing protein, partial [Bacteroidota bacterium]|nr:ACT domain-containing protein [Bacteroidota bacterium]